MAAVTRRQYSGAAVATTITAGINPSDVTCTLAATTGWPNAASIPFIVVIEPGTSAEEKCSATISGSTLTLTRAADDTTAVSHGSGAAIYPVFSADEADEANAIAAVMTTRGDIIKMGSGPTVSRLGIGTSGQALISNGTDPLWGQVADAGVASAANIDKTKIAGTAVTLADTGTVTNTMLAGSIANTKTTAASANTASAIVARDASGNFSAGVITAVTDQGQGRGVGIAADSLNTNAILQFTNNAISSQLSSLVATNNLLTVSTPLAATSFSGPLTGNVTGTASVATTSTLQTQGTNSTAIATTSFVDQQAKYIAKSQTPSAYSTASPTLTYDILMSCTGTTVASRYVNVRVNINAEGYSGSFLFKVADGATSVYETFAGPIVGGGISYPFTFDFTYAPSAGSHTWSVQIARVGGVNVNLLPNPANTNNVNQIFVYDAGAV